MKTQILFFFDTEDFTAPENAGAILEITKILDEEGVTGHFAVVGLLAKQLTVWGREDVKQALRRHIIGTHTYGHSLHPDIAELSDDADYQAAHDRVMASEQAGVSLLREHLGIKNPLFATRPGNSMSYVGMYCYHEMGIPFFCDTPVYDERFSLIDYCSMTMIPYGYGFGFEELFLDGNHKDQDEVLDELSNRKRVVMYLHPNMCFKTEFWDVLNFDHENLREFGDWIPAKDRPREEVDAYFHDIRMFIRRLKQDERFSLVTLYDVQRQLDVYCPAPITRDNIGVMASALQRRFRPIDIRGYCVADLFYASAVLLRGDNMYIPGTVKGFLDAPRGITEPRNVTRRDMVEAARKITVGEFIPPEIMVGDSCVGPADFLRGALALLMTDVTEVLLVPGVQNVDLAAFPELKEMDLARDLWRRSLDFKDAYVSERTRLQSWTLRYYE